MNVKEISQLVDQRVFEHTEKHLDEVQKAIIEGTLQEKTYKDIGQKCSRSESHVRDEGAKLWQLLSDAFGEEVKKSNFRSSIERMKIKSSPNSLNVVNSNNNHFCHTQTLTLPNGDDKNTKINPQSKSIYHDLTLAPQIIDFYDRKTELQTLTDWIFASNTRLIAILGIFGLGKTSLVKRFVDLNLDQFEVVIWKSLKFPKSLDLLLDDFLDFCQQKPQNTIEDKLRQFLDILTHKKCLIVLDDLQNLFAIGQMAGSYKSEYSD
jgi:hypothetical protein